MSVHEGALFPLWGAQEGPWSARRIDPGNPADNAGECVEIHGVLDPGLFEVALRRAIDETQTLARRCTDAPARPRVLLDPGAYWPMRSVDVSAAVDPRAAARAWIAADLASAVDLDDGPLYSQALFRAAHDRWLWFLRAHHLLLDDHSYQLVARRVVEVYTALAAGRPVPTARFCTPRQTRRTEQRGRRHDG